MNPPALLLFAGDWAPYEDMVYAAFLETIVDGSPRFRGQPVTAQRRPETKGKGFSFWHVISESTPQDKREEERTPDFRRCERIRWIAWAISNAERPGFLCWENQRGRETMFVIWAEAHDYAVILAVRNGYYLLKSAYVVDQPHRRQKFRSEYEAYRRRQKG